MSDHFVNHRWGDELIVPCCALNHNIEFITSKNTDDLYIISRDEVKAKVILWKEVHICELEKDIQRLYKISAWDFVMRWYNGGTHFSSAYFIYIKSKKIDV